LDIKGSGGTVKIIKKIKVPTGDICIISGDKGLLEFLSIGDYGKEQNIKADFLGITREINGVPNQKIMPLSEKWVITISTQYGCSMNCTFCDVPKVGAGINATFDDLIRQVLEGIKLHPEVPCTKRLNIHFARMGEPTFNPNVLDATKWFKTHIDPEYKIHPVVSTMMPRNNIWLKTFIHTWMRIKNRLLQGEAGLQISINSTDSKQRKAMFNNNACSLEEISNIMKGIIPNGRKITLNIALADDYIVNASKLKKYFSPNDFLIKITPIHLTTSCKENNIKTNSGYKNYYPYKKVESDCKNEGFDVIVFVPSMDEDESKITCGNVILAEAKNRMIECTK